MTLPEVLGSRNVEEDTVGELTTTLQLGKIPPSNLHQNGSSESHMHDAQH